MGRAHQERQNTKRGIVLISPLVSLILLISVTMMVQSVAMANTKVLKKLETQHEADLWADAERELGRPKVLGAMLNFDKLQIVDQIRKVDG